MAENKMEEVAAMFGKELGEKFKIYRIAQRDRCEIINGKFTERGLLTTCCLSLEDDYDFDRNDLIMRQLLTGKAEIVEEQVYNE